MDRALHTILPATAVKAVHGAAVAYYEIYEFAPGDHVPPEATRPVLTVIDLLLGPLSDLDYVLWGPEVRCEFGRHLIHLSQLRVGQRQLRRHTA